jgi:hypothetical protein
MQKFQAQFHKEADVLRTVQFWIGELRHNCQDFHDDCRFGRPPLDDFSANILDTFDKSPLRPTRLIAETLLNGHATMFWHLHESLGFPLFLFH